VSGVTLMPGNTLPGSYLLKARSGEMLADNRV